jgi:ATPase family associated with various cellular activities (AAA)
MAKIEAILSDKIENVPLSEIDAQEHLSTKRLKALQELGRANISNNALLERPKDSLIQLMFWTETHFSPHLSAKSKINRFIHNKIIIDGEFVQFAEESKVKISPLLRDSIVSWKTDEGNESFFMQGVFLIERGDTKFLHCALFHKGNQNEDEISFFILVDDDHYENYIKLRNEFDEWSVKRDRDHLLIHVVDGEDIPYERNSSWEDLFLPDELKKNIRLSIEGFLKSKHIYESRNIAWKRGVIFWGTQGCGKTSLIRTIISNYDFKPVTVEPGADESALRDAFNYAQAQSPALLYFEDLDSLLQDINVSQFLNLMDGISSKNGLLIIATANSLDMLKANIKERPSRFDRKFEIPLPDYDMSLKYIKKWFGKTIPDKESKNLATYSVKYGFSYAYLKELYISSVYYAIADSRDIPTSEDIASALKQMIDEKFRKNGRSIGIDKYHKGNNEK